MGEELVSWAKIDDRANEHRKQLAAGSEACWLWTCGLMYTNRQPARNGFIPDQMIGMLYPMRNPKKLADKLVEVGLWLKVEGGYSVHDFLSWNQSKEEREAELAAGRERAAKSYASRVAKNSVSSPEEKEKDQNSSGMVEEEVSSLLPGMTIQPKHSRKTHEVSMPEPFEITENHLKHAEEKGWPIWWLKIVHEDFCVWAKSKGKRYANWDMALYHFARNKIDFKKGPQELAHLAPKVEQEPVRGDVSAVHRAWQEAFKRQDKLFGPVDDNAMVIARAIDAYGLPDTVLVARYAPFDGMVSGRDDQNKVKHESMAYIFGNTAAFGRILKMAKQKEAETHTETMAERTARLKLL